MTTDPKRPKIATLLAHGPHNPSAYGGFVNPPIVRASTVLFENVRDMRERKQRYSYGRSGTPTSDALCGHLAELEGCDGVLMTPSGLSALTTSVLALVKAGDHILVTDSAYKPTRAFCEAFLTRMGVETTFYDPLIGPEIRELMRENTSLVIVESPGSLTFEMQDLPAIAHVAHAGNALVLVDNTWATPLFHKPLDLGADVSIQAATKYLVGHSDALVGAISANNPTFARIKQQYQLMGQWCGPDDMYLTERGVRTLQVRLKQHMASTLSVTEAIAKHPVVTNVRYPALETDPGYAIWKRDFTGASGLFGVDLLPGDEEAVGKFLDTMKWFGLGYSWGGFESLAIYAQHQIVRNTGSFDMSAPLLRFHIGLEDPEDLIADLMAGLDRYAIAIGR